MEQLWAYTPSGYTILGRIPKKRHPDVPGSRPFHPLSRGKMGNLHRQLTKALPALGQGGQLSSAIFDADFSQALQCHHSDDFKWWYLEANCLKRYQGKGLTDPLLRKEKALEKLLDSEIRCRVSNERLHDLFSRGWVPNHIHRALKRAKVEIANILGRFDWDELPRACAFSSGATTEFPRRKALISNKWHEGGHITPRALPYATAFLKWASPDLFGEGPGGLHCPRFTIEDANVVFTVPKNFERDRTACKPVTWNSFLQKGIGSMFRKRAQRKRNLLQPDAQEYHGLLAKLGSATGALATMDLAGASDSISLALIAELLPGDWVRVLFDLREEYGLLPDGSRIRWEKISSMGNGFTFELETILFYALVRSVCSKGSLVSVYGDDIICPTRYAQDVAELLMYCGFEINREKTFVSGGFRESCGAHYFRGVDVKPFYITDLPRTLGDVINLHNDIVRWHAGSPISDRWAPVHAACRELVPRSYWGPPSVEGVLWAEWDESRPVYARNLQAWRIRAITRDTAETLDRRCYVGSYLEQLWKSGNEDASASSSYRVTGTRERGVYIFVDRAQWNRVTAETLCT